MPTVGVTDSTINTSIYYTTDGSVPSQTSQLYSSSTGIIMPASGTVNAVAIDSAGNTSAVATASYTVTLPAAPAPTMDPGPAAYTAAQSVTITDSSAGASIYYTTDGSTPTTSSTLYTVPVIMSGSGTLSAIAVMPPQYGYSQSAVGGGAYTILLPPSFSLAAGLYTTAQQLSITEATVGASIFYTTDGTIPTTSSTPYTAPITISSSETVNAIATIQASGSGGNLTTANVSAHYVIRPPGTSIVQSGTEPVAGASIQLYTVGTNGYASPATPLLQSPVVSDSNGLFSISGQYTCTPGSYLYLTASGGTVGGSTASNPSLTLAATIGLCDQLTSTTSFTLTEETTVATAYALAQFAQGTTFGVSQSSQPGSGSTAPANNFATSSTNSVGMANAMAISRILADPYLGTSPGNNSNGSAQPEWWQVNLIANILSGCVRSTGGVAGDGTACGTLFANVQGANATAPADTLQAALDLALSPASSSASIANLYALIPAGAPYTPYPTSASAVTDFSVAIQYSPVGVGNLAILKQPSGISIDSLGNAWIGNVPHSASTSTTNPGASFLAELTPTGVPIQAGSTAGNYLINSYTLNGTSTAMSGQVWLNSKTYTLDGMLVPELDTTNNVWFNDRQNKVMAEVIGSGTTYSNNLAYNNGGSAGTVGHQVPQSTNPSNPSYPLATYVDGKNNVWFDVAQYPMVTGSNNCGPGFNPSGSIGSGGRAVYVNEDPTSVYSSKADNMLATTATGYIVVDPDINDKVGTGTNLTEIAGAPFVWILGYESPAYTIVQGYTGVATAPTAYQYPGCDTPITAIGIIADSAAGDKTANPGHSSSPITNIPNPNLSGDFFKFLSLPEDYVFDKFGNLWIANGGQINTTTTAASEIMSSISKVTPNYGATWSSSSTSNFKFSVFHNAAGMIDGSTVTGYPSYLTTDGSGNVWFAMSNSSYLNELTNNGTALSPNGAATSNAGFAGSLCVLCTFNGTQKTYQRPTSAINRPAVDQSGNVWVPVSGVGSTYVDLVVGIATPRSNPDSLGLKNNNFASEP
jgi:hypothetical protein